MNKTTISLLALSVALCVASALTLHARGEEIIESEAPRFFEQRIYTTADGKLDALHARFRDHTNALFTKHGMTMIGYWTPVDAPRSKNTLIYILAYPSRAAREKSWKEFQADPDWIKAKAESERDGKLVDHVDSTFMTPTDYSPIK